MTGNRHRPTPARLPWPWLLLLTLWVSSTAMAAQPRITVIYPEAKGGYAALFEQIIGGIEAATHGAIIPQAVSAEPDIPALRQMTTQQPNDVIIALGKRGLATAKALQLETPIVAGGLLSLGEEDRRRFPAISLLPRPALLFERLKALAPETRRVHLLYNPSRHDWLLPLAKAAAKRRGLSLDARPATDLRSAARLYRQVLREMRPGSDALWLLQDSTLTGDAAVLSYLLQEAWQRDLLLFSSSPAHVRRGALFALYADKRGLGEELGRLALEVIRGRGKPGLRPTSAVRVAVNLRTASHLGLRIPYQLQRQFDLVYPRP